MSILIRLPVSLTANVPTPTISFSSHPLTAKFTLNFQSRNPTFVSARTLLRFSSNGVPSHHPDHEYISLQQCILMKRDEEKNGTRNEMDNGLNKIGSNEEGHNQIPTQAQSVVEGPGQVLVSEIKSVPEVDYLQELLAIQQQGPKSIAFFGTRNMGFMHQELIEILSYAMIITNNHIFTSGASGTNAAVIRGALRAEKPELLTVILPQSLKMQPPESRELLSKVRNVKEKAENDELPLLEASRLCNMDIISHVQQVICFAFHDSRLLMETCEEARNLRKIVTLFYLD